MSQDVLEIFQTMNKNHIDTQFVMQCAPLIAGLKCSNLLMVQKVQQTDAIRMLKTLESDGIYYRTLHLSNAKMTMLIYRKEELTDHLNRPEIRQFLSWMGYETTKLDEVLDVFVGRYRNHREDIAAFPHEMGILLGYPLVDVIGFMENEGKNFLYNGYWKVYGNLHNTVTLFQHFQMAEKQVFTLLASGMSISGISKMYVNVHMRAVS